MADRGTDTDNVAKPEEVADIAGDLSTEAHLVGDGTTISEIGFAGDSDWFKVEVTAGHTYVFDLEGSDTGAGSQTDPFLRLFDSDGNELRADDGSGEGRNARLGFSATTDGLVFVASEDRDGYGDDLGTYRLSAHRIDGDPADNAATEATLQIGGSATGAIDWEGEDYGYGDSDWYRVELLAGHTYVFDLETKDSGRFTLDLASLHLMNAEGNEISGDLIGQQCGYSSTTSGPFFVAVDAGEYRYDENFWGYYWETSSGTYRLTAREVFGDVESNTSTGASLAVGSSSTGVIDYNGDSDWFRVDVEAGKSYVFGVDGQQAAIDLGLFDVDGNRLLYGQGSESPQLGFTATVDGPVFVGVTGYGEIGAYRISAEELTGDVPDHVSTGAVLASGETRLGAIDFAGDADWYRVQLEAGKTYVIDVDGASVGGRTLADLELLLLDANGFSLGGSEGIGSAQRGFLAGLDGPVFVSVAGREGDIGSYRVSVRDIDGDVPDGPATGVSLAIGSAVSGNIDFANDVDTYRIEVQAGRTYAFDLEGADTGAGTLGNPVLSLLDSAGNSLGNDQDGGTGRNESLGFVASEDGTVFVSAGGRETTDGHEGGYRLSVREVLNDVPDSAATVATLTTADVVTGLIDMAGDQDWYRFETEAGKTYAFGLEGIATGAGTLEDPYLRLLDADGNELRADDDSGAGSDAELTSITTTTAGPIYVSAEGADGSSIGAYRLRARELAGDVPDNAATGAILAVGGVVLGAIDAARDSDWFRTEVQAGKTYVFELEDADTGGGTLADPYLSLFDAGGNFIRYDQDGGVGGNALLGFTAAVDGPVFVEAQLDPFAGSAEESEISGTYRLSVRELDGDPADSTATKATLDVGGSVVGTVDFPGDVDWFGIEVAAGRTYLFDLQGVDTVNGTLQDPDLRLRSSVGEFIRPDTDGGEGGNAQLSFMAIEDGLIYVAAGGAEAGTYRLDAREVIGDVPAGNATRATLAVGGVVASAIDFTSDSDGFRVSLEAGHSYVFDVEGAASGAGTLASAAIELFYAGGGVIRHDAGGGVGGNARTTFTPTTSGELLVAVSGLDGSLGTYRLSARETTGGLWSDLPNLAQGQRLPDAAIQASADNAPAARGELFATWLGGTARFDNAIGACRIDGERHLSPEIVFASTHAVDVGDAVSLGSVDVEDRLGLFAIADGARRVPGLERLAPDDLELRNPQTGGAAGLHDGQPPELVRLDGSAPVRVGADLVFAIDDDPLSPLVNPLNPDGLAQATVGSFWRDGLEVCRVVAFEDLIAGRPYRDGDFNDAVVALSIGRLDDADIAAIRSSLFG